MVIHRFQANYFGDTITYGVPNQLSSKLEMIKKSQGCWSLQSDDIARKQECFQSNRVPNETYMYQLAYTINI